MRNNNNKTNIGKLVPSSLDALLMLTYLTLANGVGIFSSSDGELKLKVICSGKSLSWENLSSVSFSSCTTAFAMEAIFTKFESNQLNLSFSATRSLNQIEINHDKNRDVFDLVRERLNNLPTSDAQKYGCLLRVLGEYINKEIDSRDAIREEAITRALEAAAARADEEKRKEERAQQSWFKRLKSVQVPKASEVLVLAAPVGDAKAEMNNASLNTVLKEPSAFLEDNLNSGEEDKISRIESVPSMLSVLESSDAPEVVVQVSDNLRVSKVPEFFGHALARAPVENQNQVNRDQKEPHPLVFIVNFFKWLLEGLLELCGLYAQSLEEYCPAKMFRC